MTVFEKIEAQQKGHEGTAVWMIGQQLKDICRSDPRCAELVDKDLDVPAKSIVNAEKNQKCWADKQQRSNNCACVPPDVADRLLREFYGLPAAGEETNEPGELPGLLDLSSILQ